MNTDPAKLAAAHAELSAAVAKLAPAARTPNRVVPSDSVMYRSHQRIPTAPAERQMLGRLADALAKQVRAEGFSMLTVDPGDGVAGQTSYRNQTVKVDPALQDSRFVGTLVHELAHIRLNHFARQPEIHTAEVEAESVAYIVGRALGIDWGAFSAPYVANWSNGEMRLVASAKPHVLHAAKKILADL